MPLISFRRPAIGLILLGCLFLSVDAGAGGDQPVSASSKPVDFVHDIRPILAEKCLGCHNGDEPEGGLRLGEQQSALGKGASGRRAIVPRKPGESELVRRIRAADADEQMPPEDAKPLTKDEIAKLERWIAEGATWATHWAFEPLGNPVPPVVKNTNWVRNEIDRFVLAKLEANNITPSAEADRYTLIKRLYYDLLGLPPAIVDVDAFVADRSPQAYEQLVDRLLKSPHFGERWGRHWLDMAHFADSDGYEKDRARADAYLYRDWVIDAINRDMPLDRFTVEQLAGDLLPSSSIDQRVATGFLRQTLTNEEGGVDQEEFRVNACFDRTETVGTVWLGLTVGCARCHDHKYDPLPQRDFYKLFAFFNQAEETKASLPVAADDLDGLERKIQPLEAALAERYHELAPASLTWETAAHRRVMAQSDAPLKDQVVEIVSVESTGAPDTQFRIKGSTVAVETPVTKPGISASAAIDAATKAQATAAVADKDTYVLTLRVPPGKLTGFKLYALPDNRLPHKGPGWADNGNFVLTSFDATVLDSAGTEKPVALHRATSDYAQPRFGAEQVLVRDKKEATGWAVGGKVGESHWIQFRTYEPLTLSSNQVIRLRLSQQFGGRHLLGSFRILALSGDERGLEVDDKSIADALEMYPEKRVAATKQRLFEHYVSQVARDERAKLLKQEIAALQKKYHARLMDVRIMGTPRLARVTKVFHRGDFLAPTEAVDAGVPAILTALKTRGQQADRLDLARWLVSADNVLTPRVAVNHVWLHLFGQAITRTPNDLGVRGDVPTHPELLDWLASHFRNEMKWSRKELIRTIVSSATYRQASHFRPKLEAIDPRNELLFRQNRFRVESEIVRDLNLSVAQLLSDKIGGPSVFPPMPEDLARLSYANNFSWKSSEGADRYRRGMYTFFKRTIPHPSLTTFDSPDANVACVARGVSNTPLQALTLLNNETHVEAAQALAASILGQVNKDDRSRLAAALRRCVARPAQDKEIAALAKVLTTSRAYYAEHPDEASKAIGRHAAVGISPAEDAAWVSTLRVVLNLDEFVTRE
jgi:hypothetical protein